MHHVTRLQLVATRLAAVLGSAVALVALLYGALLLGAVAHTATQTKAERQIDTLAAHLGGLEAQYFATIRSITPERAKELGFTAPAHTTTIFATAASRTLTLEGFSSP